MPLGRGNPRPIRRPPGRNPHAPPQGPTAARRTCGARCPGSQRCGHTRESVSSVVSLASVDEPLDLHLDAPDPVGLIPVYLGSPDSPTEANCRDALPLAPTARPVLTTQPSKVADRSPGRDRLDVGDVAEQLEVRRACGSPECV